MLRIAMPKGRLLKQCRALFDKIGFDLSAMDREKRKLMFSFPEYGFEVMVVKPMDVPVYVEYGVADLGVAGKDVILEEKSDVYEPLDLGFGHCRMVVAQPKGIELPRYGLGLKVATKYPCIAEYHYSKKGIPVEIIQLYGSVELAPLVGLAHQIVDIVETGTTLRENNLEEVETIFEITARLIVNRSSMRLKYKRISELISAIEKGLPV